MSELKEHLFVPYSELREGDELTDAFTIAKSYYLKSEADKVIAEKDEEITRLKARIAELEALNHDLCERVTDNDDIRPAMGGDRADDGREQTDEGPNRRAGRRTPLAKVH